MANRWWTDSVALAGVDNSSPIKKPDLGFSMKGKDNNEGDDKENSEDPKEKVATTRRPRGRPPGSKNKPKPPIFVTRDSPNAFRSHVIEIANGADIADSLVQFAGRRQRGVCVLSATGTVANVTLRQPTSPGAVMALHGRFGIISLTGSFFPGPSSHGSTGLTVYLAGGQGQVVGGGVVGPLVASGPVIIMAAAFSNAVYERLPLRMPSEDDDDDEKGQGGGGSPVGTRGTGGKHPAGSVGEGSSLVPVFNVAPPNLVIPQNGQHLNHEVYSTWGQGHGHGHGHARPPF